MSLEISNLVMNAGFAYGGLTLYDVFANGKLFSESFTMNDGAAFALSVIVSNYAYDILSSFVPYLNDVYVIKLISKPLLNGLVYQYFYNMIVADKFPYERDGTKTLIIGALGSLLLNYLNSPLLSLFGYRVY